jgi:hypothetical protein
MSKPISRLWFLGPPAAILLSAFVYYAKFQSVRRWVDAKSPWVEENVGSRLPQFLEERKVVNTPRRSVSSPPSDSAGEPILEPPKPAVTPLPPSFLAADGSVDLKKLASDRGAWPPAVVLKRAKEFPAVVNGKVVGKVEVPLGTEAKLVSIKDGKLGLEYRGGGAWLAVEETDLAQRLRH